MIERARFESLYAAADRPLRLYLRRVLADAPLADDIAQEAYLRLLRSAPDRLTDSQLRSYLFATATNLMRDRWRQGAVSGEWQPLDEGSIESPASVDTAAARIDVQRTMTRLSLMQRSLLWLAYAEGYSHRDLAQLHGIQEASVRVLLYRARHMFIRFYDSENGSRGDHHD